MTYFDEKKNVQEYIRMARKYDGRELIEVLKKNLKRGSKVLELGMGPGKDLDILKRNYKVTGSDLSQVFLDIYRKKHPKADLIKLDAVSLKVKRKYDCIYSNKVLHHLSKEEIKKSFKNQATALKKGGILFHSFWYGNKEENCCGLRFIYYDYKGLEKLIGKEYELLGFQVYKEMNNKDSFYIILSKR